MSFSDAARRIGYFSLLRSNRTFRRLWLGDVVSQCGDWFTTIALFAMLLEYTGRAESVGLVLIARFLPGLIFGPVAGVAADRLPRRAILVTCDLLRAAAVLGYLLIDGPEDAWLAYLISFVQLSISAFFGPAQQASVGSVVGRDGVVAAYSLQGITWSSMLALGALLGGVFAEFAGRDAAFMLNSVAYLASALLVGGAKIAGPQRRKQETTWKDLVGIPDIVEGLRFLAHKPNVRRIIFAKASWNLGFGGAIMLYSIFGERVFRVGGGSAATSIGIIYGARGIGALLGPTTARLVGGDEVPYLDRAAGYGFLLVTVAYLLFSASPWFSLAIVALILAHMGAGTIWAFTISLLNLSVPDRLRGRVFAAEGALSTLAITLSTWLTGVLMDRFGVGPRPMMALLAVFLLIPAVLWKVLPNAEGPTAEADDARALERAARGTDALLPRADA